MERWYGAFAAAGTAALLAAAPLESQTLPLKRALPTDPVSSCAAEVTPKRSISRADSVEAERLALLGSQAAIAGDPRAARDLFARAAARDPRDPGTAYQLARARESLGEVADAVRSYCMVVALSPSGPDAADARERIAALAPARPRSVPPSAAAQFRIAVSAFDARRWSAAEEAFTNALQIAPALAEAFYDRALANAAQGEGAQAARDLERYLALLPTASDRAAVLVAIRRLRPGGIAPGSALARGLLVPGLGQFATGRPMLGVAVLGATAGAVVFAVRPVAVQKTDSYTDPFGNVREYSYATRERSRLVPGLAAAAGIAVLGAVESYVHARRDARPASRWQPLVMPSRDASGAVSIGLAFRFGGN